MQYVPTIRRFISSALVPTAMLYGSIFVANYFSLKACSTAYFPPSIHCQWDVSELKDSLPASIARQ
jgi:hypothetical protein